MTRIDHGLRREAIEHVTDAEDDLLRVTTRQVRPADATLEEGVTRKAVQPKEKADRSLGVARSVEHADVHVLERQGRIMGQAGIDGERSKPWGHEGHLGESLPVED